jgi:membrane protein CcdC involved in cytochrome C biogenesis
MLRRTWWNKNKNKNIYILNEDAWQNLLIGYIYIRISLNMVRSTELTMIKSIDVNYN